MKLFFPYIHTPPWLIRRRHRIRSAFAAHDILTRSAMRQIWFNPHLPLYSGYPRIIRGTLNSSYVSPLQQVILAIQYDHQLSFLEPTLYSNADAKHASIQWVPFLNSRFFFTGGNATSVTVSVGSKAPCMPLCLVMFVCNNKSRENKLFYTFLRFGSIVNAE